MLTLSTETKKQIKDTMDHLCAIRENHLSADHDSPKEGSWERAEEEVRDEVLVELEEDFEQACNSHGFDSVKEFAVEGFEKALIEEIENWTY